MSYTIYILKDAPLRDQIISPKEIPVWIAVINEKCIQPKDLKANTPKAIANYIKFTCVGTLDEAIDGAWLHHENAIRNWISSINSFRLVAKTSFKTWRTFGIKTPDETQHGATCERCKVFNEYALKSDNFICSSCKSYQSMYS